MDKRTAVRIAVGCARHVLRFYAKKCPGDTRPRQAIEAAAKYLRTPTTAAADAAKALPTPPPIPPPSPPPMPTTPSMLTTPRESGRRQESGNWWGIHSMTRRSGGPAVAAAVDGLCARTQAHPVAGTIGQADLGD